MEWTPQGFLPQELNQPPRTQYASSEAALSTKGRAAGGREGCLALGRERGMGQGVETWVETRSETSIMMQVFLALRDRGVVGQSGRKEDILSPIRGCGDIIFCKW